jgi:hypothetical protein
MTRVVWTNEEKTAVFESMVDVFIEQPHTTNRTAMHHAQCVLTKDRRVKVTDQRVHTYKARIENARVRAKTRVLKQSSPDPIEMQPDPTPPRNDTDIGVLFTALVDRLVEQVLDKVEARLRTRLHDEVDNQFDAEYAKRNAQMRKAMVDGGWLPDAVKAKRPNVLIVGLLEGQATSILAQYRMQNVTLLFRSSDDAKSRIIPHADVAILMTKFISHAAQDRVRAAVPLVRLCNGGLQSLSQEIDRFLQGGT